MRLAHLGLQSEPHRTPASDHPRMIREEARIAASWIAGYLSLATPPITRVSALQRDLRVAPNWSRAESGRHGLHHRARVPPRTPSPRRHRRDVVEAAGAPAGVRAAGRSAQEWTLERRRTAARRRPVSSTPVTARDRTEGFAAAPWLASVTVERPLANGTTTAPASRRHGPSRGFSWWYSPGLADGRRHNRWRRSRRGCGRRGCERS